ncbi:hypothetical protein ILP92_13635 [Maribius pontilimi]|uniref:CheB-type methylesterase domain-containing protein n=1 Tax=Palleronia pontilimi TaxID=1964209 RepID=A0A934IB16_9RHOB|nr:hypothetical protein [Palleronia pontilimi]
MVQAPDGAHADGMPRSAIATGAADHVTPIAKMPEAGVGKDEPGSGCDGQAWPARAPEQRHPQGAPGR